MAGLLVSVRSESEARAAVRGGAAVIDVKEPAAGALGMAPLPAIRDVVRAVGSARPVSAALGEIGEWPARRHGELAQLPAVAWLKVGLSRAGAEWPESLVRLGRARPDIGWIAVAYADWRRAAAPEPARVVRFAIEHGWAGVLLDTWAKDGTRLTDWLSRTHLAGIAAACRAAGRLLALAGSLQVGDLTRLAPLAPELFAVRGAACRGGDRSGAIDPAAVRRLVEACRSPRECQASR